MTLTRAAAISAGRPALAGSALGSLPSVTLPSVTSAPPAFRGGLQGARLPAGEVREALAAELRSRAAGGPACRPARGRRITGLV